MKDTIKIYIVIKNESIINENVTQWFKRMSFFHPTDMACKKLTGGKFKKYDLKKFYENISKEIEVTYVNNIRIKGGKNSISIRKDDIDNGISSLCCKLEYDIFQVNSACILSIIDKYMLDYNGIVAYVCSLQDLYWQDNEFIDEYELKGRSLEGVVIKKCSIFPDKDIVDIRHNPGHTHIINGIWLGSCWKMWYGKEYFRYVPKYVLVNFTACYENKKLSDDCIRITLYESVWEYDKNENRDIQMDFRKSTGIDEVANNLKNVGNLSADIDTSIEINEGAFEHGGIRLVKYYYDSKDELTVKSQATEVRIYELGEKGEVMWSDIKKINL